LYNNTDASVVTVEDHIKAENNKTYTM